jgi:hypothetical protein
MEGNMHGPSSQDCEKSYVRTGVITAGMIIHREERSIAGMVQIRNSTERPQSSQVLVLYLERPITHQWAAAWS